MKALTYHGAGDVRMDTVDDPHLIMYSPEVIVSHILPSADAVRGYDMFNKKQDACRKVVLVP